MLHSDSLSSADYIPIVQNEIHYFFIKAILQKQEVNYCSKFKNKLGTMPASVVKKLRTNKKNKFQLKKKN